MARNDIKALRLPTTTTDKIAWLQKHLSCRPHRVVEQAVDLLYDQVNRPQSVSLSLQNTSLTTVLALAGSSDEGASVLAQIFEGTIEVEEGPVPSSLRPHITEPSTPRPRRSRSRG